MTACIVCALVMLCNRIPVCNFVLCGQNTTPMTSSVCSFISLMLQFISMLVGLMLATALIDFVTISYNYFPLIDGEMLRIVRQYCGPVAAVGIFVEIAAVMFAGQTR